MNTHSSKAAIVFPDNHNHKHELMGLSITLRRKMDEGHLTIFQMSEISGLSVDTIKAILYHRVKDVKLSTAVKLAHAFDCSLDDLVK